jgi:hypothetical protein
VKGLLLGTTALKLSIAGEPALLDWLESQGDTPLHTTYASVASLLATAEGMTDVSLRREWIERLTEDVPANFGPRIHGFDLAAARNWSAVRAVIAPATKLVQHDLLVVAVALSEELDYVAPREPWHDAVSNLRQQDPWTRTSYPR